MFLDLKLSTEIAEKLGYEKYGIIRKFKSGVYGGLV